MIILASFQPKTLLYDVWKDSWLGTEGMVASLWPKLQICNLLCNKKCMKSCSLEFAECLPQSVCGYIWFLLVPKFSKFKKSKVYFLKEVELFGVFIKKAGWWGEGWKIRDQILVSGKWLLVEKTGSFTYSQNHRARQKRCPKAQG